MREVPRGLKEKLGDMFCGEIYVFACFATYFYPGLEELINEESC